MTNVEMEAYLKGYADGFRAGHAPARTGIGVKMPDTIYWGPDHLKQQSEDIRSRLDAMAERANQDAWEKVLQPVQKGD